MHPTLLLLLAQSLAAMPEPPPPPAAAPTAPYTVQMFDTDRDGSVSRAEASGNAQLAAKFRELDVNANGALEPAEFARFEQPAPPPGGTPPPALPPEAIHPAPPASAPPKP